MSRANADRLLAEMIERCKQVNQNGDFVFYVRRLHVFGSYNSDTPDLGDLDVVIETESRPGIGDHVLASRARLMELGKRAANFFQTITFGQSEVLTFVKGRSPYVSIHSPKQLTIIETKVAFAASPKKS